MRETDPLLERLADANPVSAPDRPGESDRAEAVLARILADRPARDVPPSVSRPKARRVAAAALLLVTVVGGALLLRGGGDAPASASELLRRAATIAAGEDSASPARRFLYTKVVEEQLVGSDSGSGGWSAIHPVVHEQWVAVDGSGRDRAVFGGLRYFGGRDRERWDMAGAPSFELGLSDHLFAAGVLTYEDPSSLPVRTSALDAALRTSVSAQHLPSDVAVFVKVGELLARGDAPPGLRAALYRVVAQLSGVELIGDATDPSGRPGVAVAMTYDDGGAGVRVVMIFDPETSALLAQESYLLERASWVDAAPGTRLSFTTYLETGWTESTRERPAP